MHDTDTPDEQMVEPEAPPVAEEAPPSPNLRLVFAAPPADKPIHALRTGTFTDGMGRETTFTADDMAGMAERLNAGAERRRPPINEGHDMGRAVGRMLRGYARHKNNHLYIEPKWNGEGRRLLSDEVYDSFSIEITPAPKDGLPGAWQIVGGALTNYPAVDGLSPLSLAAPPAGAVPTLILPPVEEPPMTDTLETQAVAPPLELPPLPQMSDAMQQQQIQAYSTAIEAQMRQQFEAIQRQAEQAAQARFERWQAEQQEANAIRAFAQHVTTPTIDRRHALPFSADQIAAALLALPAANRPAVRELLDGVLQHGLVPFERVGTGGEGQEERNVAEEWSAALFAKTQQGMSRSAAIEALRREQPALFAAYNESGATVTRRKGVR